MSLKLIADFLPLVVNTIAWDEKVLNLKGTGWQFSAPCGWRIIDNEKLLCGYETSDLLDEILLLEKQSIINIETQSKLCDIDPVFVFNNGYKLEIYTMNSALPWTFRSQLKQKNEVVTATI